MASIAITRTMDTKELRRLARMEKSGRVAARMFAIANVLSGMSREKSAQLAGMERQTLRDWVHRFNAEGVNGLRDRRHSGRPCEIGEDDRKRLCTVVEEGPSSEQEGLVRWRRVDLKKWLKDECNADYHERSVGKLLKRLGYSHISVRPAHPKADPVLLDNFKKTSRQKSKQHSLRMPKARSSNSGSKMKQGSDRKER